MKKYNIYAGLGGGFGGAHFCETAEFDTEEEAFAYAEELAKEEYDSYEGLYGLTTIEDVEADYREENEIENSSLDGRQIDDIKDTFNEERFSWLSYRAVPADNDPDWDYETNTSNL